MKSNDKIHLRHQRRQRERFKSLQHRAENIAVVLFIDDESVHLFEADLVRMKHRIEETDSFEEKTQIVQSWIERLEKNLAACKDKLVSRIDGLFETLFAYGTINRTSEYVENLKKEQHLLRDRITEHHDLISQVISLRNECEKRTNELEEVKRGCFSKLDDDQIQQLSQELVERGRILLLYGELSTMFDLTKIHPGFRYIPIYVVGSIELHNGIWFDTPSETMYRMLADAHNQGKQADDHAKSGATRGVIEDRKAHVACRNHSINVLLHATNLLEAFTNQIKDVYDYTEDVEREKMSLVQKLKEWVPLFSPRNEGLPSGDKNDPLKRYKELVHYRNSVVHLRGFYVDTLKEFLEPGKQAKTKSKLPIKGFYGINFEIAHEYADCVLQIIKQVCEKLTPVGEDVIVPHWWNDFDENGMMIDP